MSGNEKGKEGGGSVYFQNGRSTELAELQMDLDSMKVDLQKEAMKQIIAAMTIGKDVSPLFPYVVKCMRTSSVELKKLVYLYIINYARTKPDQAILAVNAFHQDATDRTSPLIRALAVRTMGCIRVDMIVTYLCETLKLVLKDEDAYVRKTACICVAKLYNTCPSLVKENGFISILQSMITDGNAIVVANALVALLEISVLSGENCLTINSKTLKRVLAALNEANEWGQVFILDAIINYSPTKKVSKKSEDIIDAVIPRLSHANPAVVLSALKVILKFIDNVENIENVRTYCKKISGSLMTVMASGSQIQYILLRGMHAIVQKRPSLVDKDFRYFFIQYNDPVYVKFEKLDILYKLADGKNYEYLLQEFKSYACLEFNMDLVNKAVKYLGNIAFKFEKACDLSVDYLNEVLEYNQDFTVNQGIIVVRDLMRKYKNPKTKEFLSKINDNFIKLVTLPESKAALLYIIGDHCNDIKNSTDLISSFVENFGGENEKVKLQILNAAVKNFVNKPDESEELVKVILQKGGEETENPDVRDRAYMYWRLLENDPDAAKEMVLTEKPAFELKGDVPLDGRLVDDIIDNLTNVSAIYHKFAAQMISKEDMIIVESEEESEGEVGMEKSEKKNKPAKIIEMKVNKTDVDLLGLGEDLLSSPNNSTPKQTSVSTDQNVLLNLFGSSSEATNDVGDIEFLANNNSDNNISIFNNSSGVTIPKPYLCFKPTDKGKNGTVGLSIHALFHRDNQKLLLGMNIRNNTMVSVNNFSVMINSNSFGVSINSGNNIHLKDFFINSETSKNLILTLEIDNERNSKKPPESPYTLEVCVRNNIDDFYFDVPLLINVLYTENGKMSNQAFVPFYKQNNPQKFTFTYENSLKDDITNEASIGKIFERNNIFEVAKNSKADPPLFYYSALISNSIPIIFEISFPKSKRFINILLF